MIADAVIFALSKEGALSPDDRSKIFNALYMLERRIESAHRGEDFDSEVLRNLEINFTAIEGTISTKRCKN